MACSNVDTTISCCHPVVALSLPPLPPSSTLHMSVCRCATCNLGMIPALLTTAGRCVVGNLSCPRPRRHASTSSAKVCLSVCLSVVVEHRRHCLSSLRSTTPPVGQSAAGGPPLLRRRCPLCLCRVQDPHPPPHAVTSVCPSLPPPSPRPYPPPWPPPPHLEGDAACSSSPGCTASVMWCR